MTLIPATEASLKRAMRDPRDWQSGHPERGAYNAWVSVGPRSWHNQIPEQPGEAEAAAEGSEAPAEPLLPSPPTIDELIAASSKKGSGLGPYDADQHTRGGEAQREADVRAITTVPGKVHSEGRSSYSLLDGRQMTTRPYSSDALTLEVARPNPERPGRFIPTHKLRY